MEIKTCIKNLKQYSLVFLGILLKKPITGPLSVQIDLTNQCNNECIACWCRSPFLKELAMPRKEVEKSIPFSKFKELIEEFSRMGVREVYLTGGGEPFMHPEIMKIIELIKKKSMRCSMSTNFTLLDKAKIKRLVELGADEMNISVWASNPKSYARTHLNQKAEQFAKIKTNLEFLNKTKIEMKKTKPFVNIHNVILSLNADEIEEMIEFAFEVDADSVDFTPVDTIPGKTDFLKLNKKQCSEILKKLSQINEKIDFMRKKFKCNTQVKGVDLLGTRIKNTLSSKKYDDLLVDALPCYAGWTFARIMADGNVIPCLKAHRIPSGNIFNENFRSIWYGKKENFFRKQTFVYEKAGSFFKQIGNDPASFGCRKGCDNIEMNAAIHKFIGTFLFFKRRI